MRDGERSDRERRKPINAAPACPRSAWVRRWCRSSDSHSSVAKKVSHQARDALPADPDTLRPQVLLLGSRSSRDGFQSAFGIIGNRSVHSG
jgi:hypothetical protein